MGRRGEEGSASGRGAFPERTERSRADPGPAAAGFRKGVSGEGAPRGAGKGELEPAGRKRGARRGRRLRGRLEGGLAGALGSSGTAARLRRRGRGGADAKRTEEAVRGELVSLRVTVA